MSSVSASVSAESETEGSSGPISKSASSFFRLPLDVRLLIYRFALIANQAIDWPAEHSSHDISPALLRTCKIIYHEAAPVLYKYNRFTFSHPSDCNIFKWIMDVQTFHITNLAFRIRERDLRVWTAYHVSEDTIRSLTADIPNLQSLVVFLRQQRWPFDVNPDEAFQAWGKNQRLRNLCMSLEKINANITVVCSIEILQPHFDHLIATQAPFLAVHRGYARTTQAVEIHSIMAVLELISPAASYAEKHRIIGV